MKQFFGSLLGALVGVVISSVIIVFIIIGVISSAISDKKEVEVKANSILHLKLDGPVIEREPKNEFAKLTGFSEEKKMGLDAIVESIRKAKTDPEIKGIFIETQDIDAGMASVEEIRNALIDFKQSKKFVYAYGEAFTQKGYYLSSVADQVFINPQGGLDFKGLGAQIMFFKKMLEKLDIKVQIFRHGKFKSAVEPFDLEKMSESNRLQTQTYMNSLWNQMLKGISEERGVDVNKLNSIATNLAIRTADDAVTNGLADKALYYDEVIEELKKKTGQTAKQKLNLISVAKYKEAGSSDDEEEKVPSRNKIAIVYAVGSIESGEGDDETIGSDRIARAIRDAREDSTVKAVVLRVNSPGGSALASDVIWREVVLTKKAKPFIVSMGDVAASGGYYISCAADMIIAQPNTITGSIGVFGMMPEAGTLLSERMGITVDTVNTNANAGIGSIHRPVSEFEGQVIQQGVEDVYKTFITRVSDGRGISVADVDSIGQGRVWAGTDAMRIGLVDSLGGLDAAIAVAARKAKLGSDYRIVKFPTQKDPFADFMGKSEEEMTEAFITQQLSVFKEQYFMFRRSQALLNAKGVQARMPYDLIIE
ncbi:MAG: signal peptide peptidase SppA [Bacteroidia bacterium]|nr:signal peptide peptidase SppA [Bacteroidia bacterium]